MRVPENISIIPLPAYSPELNPVENPWHYLKSHYWSNRVHADDEALEETSMAAWHRTVLDPDQIKTIRATPWLDRAISK